ncbi:hypothetical protein KF7_1123 [Lactococcus lactis subsp. lactis]|uniref:DUF4062 domain-containing protein n=1 Tax=Lactococcus lactis TaxID=1358 RepID=UPI00071DCA42|nr:DUF4062 domain-containing protein [Lactococcus lactis]KST85401.1 hypothetical protein KF7_1123 [Lactococcus lactis subsp. lactis]
MEKKYQVFISSTYTDLIEERQKAVEAILSAGHIPAGMELFHAGDETQKELISEWIEDSDIYVLILGGRYGSLDSDGMGYTHWEYEKAKELGKPFFSLVLTKNYLNNKVLSGKLQATDLSYDDAKLVEFRDEVKTKIVSNIDNIDQIEAAVIKSINRTIKKYENNLEGWIKGSSLKELEELREEKQKLTSELVNQQGEVIGMQKKAKPVKDDYIGEFSFEAIRDVLSSTLIEKDQLDEALDEVEHRGRNYFSNQLELDEYISEVRLSKIDSSLAYLLDRKSDLLSSNFELDNGFPVDNLISKYYVSTWEQFSLVKKIIIIDNTSRYQLTEAGKKFISMADISSVQDNVK